MIILLTGKPGAGKSTVIEKFIRLNTQPAIWVVTSAILRPEKGDRGGFAAANSDGVRRVISHKTSIQSDVIIGENRVDLAAVDAMFANALMEATKPGGKLTIIDEIGPIQLLSPSFTEALDSAFSNNADIVATIHYKDERLDEYRLWPNATLIEVTTANRDMLPNALSTVAKNLQTINQLTEKQQTAVSSLLRNYAEQAKLTQIQKLMNNAIHYVRNETVTQKTTGRWTVTGRHGWHDVLLRNEALVCDCDLFNGRHQYTGKADECSHIQAVIIGRTECKSQGGNMSKIGRNDPCPCGSGKKYKKCHPGEYDPKSLALQRLPDMPIVACLIADNYDILGLSPVIIARRNPETERLIIAAFICDFFCLGIKDVLFEREATEQRLHHIIDRQAQDMVDIPYDDARELILGAAKYAGKLGFSPHSRYEDAKCIIEPDKPFNYDKNEFGRDGRPFYYTGPNDNYKQIFATLEKNCGKDNFDYEIDERVQFRYDG